MLRSARRLGLLVALWAPWFAACGPRVSGGDDDDDDDGPGVDAAPPSPDAPVVTPPGDDAVWAHTNRQLYRIDPATLAVTPVGTIAFSDGINQLTDLAIDRAGGMVGISTRELYRIDKTTAAATLIASLPQSYNGLSYIDDGSGNEVLLGSTQDGQLFRIDPVSGAATRLGAFGNELRSSGDLVFIYGVGLLATVTRTDWTTDRLAHVDVGTGAATIIGDTGYDNLFGIGFWGGRVFGFAEGGAFVTIDAGTGAATVVEETSVTWWGAAVTTTAPIID